MVKETFCFSHAQQALLVSSGWLTSCAPPKSLGMHYRPYPDHVQRTLSVIWSLQIRKRAHFPILSSTSRKTFCNAMACVLEKHPKSSLGLKKGELGNPQAQNRNISVSPGWSKHASPHVALEKPQVRNTRIWRSDTPKPSASKNMRRCNMSVLALQSKLVSPHMALKNAESPRSGHWHSCHFPKKDSSLRSHTQSFSLHFTTRAKHWEDH